MDRIINVKVGGNHLSKDSKNAGVRGEANVTRLRITFDEGWDGFAKTVTFWDAQGNNPVKRIQGVDLIEDIVNDQRTYVTPIPKEPLAIAGELTFAIDGYIDGKRQKSVADKLVVKDSPNSDDATQPTDPTPTQAEQLQGEIDRMFSEIHLAVEAKESAEQAQAMAKENEATSREEAAKALESATYAQFYANQAQDAVGKNSYIGVDGYWYSWDSPHSMFVNTWVKAQAGSTVYCGDNPPIEAEVWIDPDGESPVCAPYIGANGNWYAWSTETNSFADTGVKAHGKGEKGDTPVKGVDYWNDEDKAEINTYIDEQTAIIRTDLEGIQQQINEEAHFRGYLSTNAKIQALEATPNDFAYSAESGTKWIYDAENGWQDSGTPVPDQLTPASETTPLINGVASVGSESAYARGDHRHPTDTTRVGVEEFNKFKADLETAIDRIIAIENELIGGGA